MSDGDTTAESAPDQQPENTPEQQSKQESAPAEKMLTQSQVDKLVAERLARATAKYADYAELKAKAAKHDEVIESQRSEQERAVEAARKEGADSVRATANAQLVAYAALALAAEIEFRSPGLAVKAVDLSKVEVSEDGVVDADAIRAALKELAEAEPYLVKDDTPPPPKRPRADPSQGSGKTTEPPAGQRGKDEAARRFGNRQSAQAST